MARMIAPTFRSSSCSSSSKLITSSPMGHESLQARHSSPVLLTQVFMSRKGALGRAPMKGKSIACRSLRRQLKSLGADAGQAAMHSPQPMHWWVSTYRGTCRILAMKLP